MTETEKLHYAEEQKFAEGYLPDCDLKKRVLAALKRNEPRELVVTANAYGYHFYKCPSCGHELEAAYKTDFCQFCGQRLDWEGEE